jgi:nicotinamidase/pyrazinamidase
VKRSRDGVLLAAALCLLACAEPGGGGDEVARSALIIVDMQYDFLPGGALPTTGGGEIVPLINSLQREFDLVVATQDWHPLRHMSFASSHPGHQAGDVVRVDEIDQVLWPDHAIQRSPGAELVEGLDKSRIARVFQKGMDPEIDSYSGFFDNGQRIGTGLDTYLREQGVTHVYVVGLALDYCVKFTAMDARRIGFETTLIVDASRSVDLRPSDGRDAVVAMRGAGIHVVDAKSILGATAE